ncbi:hypothetical protein WJX75_005400 [Coccomyxa subellipsoidea]|uniref:Protein kinase domain-containing protein n=1 Tax=Coccomyxa subellipsoidea TaxID=248742 RepID=A0ABR2YHV6_9CHLO
MHPFGPETEHRLVEALLAVREAIVDALVWFGDMCMALFDWLAQGQSHPVDVIKKDDDLWSPRHSHVPPLQQGYPAGMASEAAFLSHFLPAPGNHPLPSTQHISSSTLRADMQRHCLPGPGLPQFAMPRQGEGVPQDGHAHLHGQNGLRPEASHGTASRPVISQAQQPLQYQQMYQHYPPSRLTAAQPAQGTWLIDMAGSGQPPHLLHSPAQATIPANLPPAQSVAQHSEASQDLAAGAGQESSGALAEHVPSRSPPRHLAAWGPPLGSAPVSRGESPERPARQAGSALSLTDLRRMPSGPPAGMHLINPEEITLGALVGEGGFGKVYYGEWAGQEVAVKVMSAEASHQTVVLQEFQREVVTMTMLPGHPHVLRLLGACIQPPLMALVTPYCPKGSLYALLHSPTVQMSWGQVAFICWGAAKGMQHLHSHHVIHRDLKSGNLLVDDALCVRVADFGLARVMHDLHTLTGGLGTFQWMAPEVLAHQRYSKKADVYSFAVVLWECTARQVPYAGVSGIQAALAVMHRGLRPDIPGHTPPALAALIRDCWQPLPDQRPSFEDVAARLEAMYRDFTST